MNSKKQLNVLADAYFKLNGTRNIDYELEVKFGTGKFKRISQINYNNVVKKIKSTGFYSLVTGGISTLKIIPQNIEKTEKLGRSVQSNYRFDIDGLSNIQTYCRTNNIKTILLNENAQSINIIKKSDVFVTKEDTTDKMYLKSADFDDFNFRVSLKQEETIKADNYVIKQMVDNWEKYPKLFRYISRSSFVHSDTQKYPFQIDMSVVKSSNGFTANSVAESQVFSNPQSYEIEIEVIPIASHTAYNKSAPQLVKGIENIVKLVMSGMQTTNYPISHSEQTLTLRQYMHIVTSIKDVGDDDKKDSNIKPVFIGPSSKTLQQSNITLDLTNETNIPNITTPHMFCVTDKADGSRHLMFVNDLGKIYLINTNLQILFTGAITHNKQAYNSIIDGELITHDKMGKFINMFAAFDIYFENGTDVRALPFMKIPEDIDLSKKIADKSSRLDKLQKFIEELMPENIVAETQKPTTPSPKSLQQSKLQEYQIALSQKSPMHFVTKKFYPNYSRLDKTQISNDKSLIFTACTTVLKSTTVYNTDGLIITPTLFGVGGNKIATAGELLKKITWDYSFKWKPPEFNTNDFLVTTKKDENGRDVLTPIFQEGIDNYETVQYQQYKTLILRVGYDTKKHRNPYNDMLNDKFDRYGDTVVSDNYVPAQFFPTSPYDLQAGLCNVMVEMDGTNSNQMFTEERETFADDMIVEFRYDKTRESLWKWIPLRVRYDKTDEYNHGKSVYGNNYATANDNWHSIHYPVTQEMITGTEVPPTPEESDVYYNTTSTDRKLFAGLRDFHNLFIKKTLIQQTSNKGDILIDFACGKAGDLPKWTAAELSFVFGIDVSKDNLENKLNGACIRYLKNHRDNKNSPYALFVHGNSAVNIRNGSAMLNHVSKQITESVFGTARKDPALPPAVLRQSGRAINGFDISSCQFAMHYMFESNVTFYNFIRNVSECTKINGYFIGTCYDGETVFNMLKSNDIVTIADDNTNKKMWEIIKDYTSTEFRPDQNSLGHKILVYQESINQVIPEFLVNFKFLIETMKTYGFELLPTIDAHNMGLPSGSEMFDKLFNRMSQECKSIKGKKYGTALQMSSSEKRVSFLNRYFIFKKMRAVDTETLTNEFLSALPQEIQYEQEKQHEAEVIVKNVEETAKKQIKRTNKRIVLGEDTSTISIAKPVIKPKKLLIIEDDDA